MQPPSTMDSAARLRAMRWRLWSALAGGLVILLLAVARDYVGGHFYTGTFAFRLKLAELALASGVVFGCGWPLLASAWRTVHTGRVDRFVAFCLAAVLAYAYGVLALAAPGLFPTEMRRADVGVNPHFEVGVLVVVIALFLQLRSGAAEARRREPS